MGMFYVLVMVWWWFGCLNGWWLGYVFFEEIMWVFIEFVCLVSEKGLDLGLKLLEVR